MVKFKLFVFAKGTFIGWHYNQTPNRTPEIDKKCKSNGVQLCFNKNEMPVLIKFEVTFENCESLIAVGSDFEETEKTCQKESFTDDLTSVRSRFDGNLGLLAV